MMKEELAKGGTTPKEQQEIRGRLSSVRHELKFIADQLVKEGGSYELLRHR